MSATNFPTLYHLSKHGAIYSWDIWVENDTIYTSTGQLEGQRVFSSKRVTPKNVGRANSTTVQEQAFREAKSMHKNKLDRKYSLTIEEAKQDDIQPMLAQKFEEKKQKLSYPVHFQPKLDGVRCIARWDDENERVILTSRGNKEWTVPSHINKELEKILPKGYVLDGELYIHGVGFQTITSWVKKLRPETENIEFHVYDMPVYDGDDSLPWELREQKMVDFFYQAADRSKIIYVPSHVANSEADVARLHEQAISDGYEGGIVRAMEGVYQFGYRSAHLLKVKAFDDGEFEVIGYTNGDGKFEKCCIFICKNKNGLTFKATPKGKQVERERMLIDGEKYIGKMLTVEHFGWTEDGLPRFPVGKGFRSSEDLGK